MKSPFALPLIASLLLSSCSASPEESTTMSDVDDVTNVVEETMDIGAQNIALINMETGAKDGRSVVTLELAPVEAVTACGKADTSIYTIVPATSETDEGESYVMSYTYETVEDTGNGTFTTYNYAHLTDDFYNNDSYGFARSFNPGEWDWDAGGDPVLTAQLSEESTFADEFTVKWTLISNGQEMAYSEAIATPSECADKSLYISSPFDVEKLQETEINGGFFQAGIYYKDVLLDSTTLMF